MVNFHMRVSIIHHEEGAKLRSDESCLAMQYAYKAASMFSSVFLGFRNFYKSSCQRLIQSLIQTIGLPALNYSEFK